MNKNKTNVMEMYLIHLLTYGKSRDLSLVKVTESTEQITFEKKFNVLVNCK